MKVGVFDIEANGFLHQVTRVHCIVVKDITTKEIHKFPPNKIDEGLKHLESFDVLIAHNGIGYDFPVLEKLHGWVYCGKKVDSLIMSRLLNPNRILPFHCLNRKAGPHSLEAWGYRVGRGKPEHDDWLNYTPEMLHRCSEDVEILELTYQALLEEARGANWRNAFLLSFELFTNLHKQAEYGWLVDQKHMEMCVRQLTKWVARIDAVITPRLPSILEICETKKQNEYNYVRKPFLKSGAYSQISVDYCIDNGIAVDAGVIGGTFSRITFRKVNLNSNAETKDYLLSLGWQPLEWNTDDEGKRTSPKLSKDDPFEGIEGKLGRLVAKRVQCRQRCSIIVGLQSLVREDGRIASVVNTLAVTGRATHRNIVNIPKPSSFYGKQMRKIFTSRDGYVLVGTDADSCQLRMLGGRMGSQAYIDAIVSGDKSKGTDLHSLTQKIGDIESRDIAKNVMYCLLFGGGDVKLGKTAKQVGRGSELRTKLYNGFDGLGALMERLIIEWKATARQRFNPKFNRMEYFNGKITGLDGRPITVPSEHQLLVYLLQSDEAIMLTKAFNLANERLSAKFTYGLDFGFCIWMHDEYQVECRESIKSEVKSICEQAIADAGTYYNITCPHIGTASYGKNWAETH